MENPKCSCPGPTDEERAALPEYDLDDDMNFHERHCQFFIEQKFIVMARFQKVLEEARITYTCPGEETIQ